jgi:hypothetical protein
MSTRQQNLAEAINWDHAREFSYTAHHNEVLDYVCLFRSAGLTLKAYFFDEGCDGEAAVPHTHRYDFDTRVLAGAVHETRFSLSAKAPYAYELYDYDCIVEGGSGFTPLGPSPLRIDSITRYEAGDVYSNRAHVDIHTLGDVEPGTIILLTQYADVGPKRTFGWSKSGPPNMDGIYRPMDNATLKRRVDRLREALEP